jgi:alkyl hydroperoxide reductase subunit D
MSSEIATTTTAAIDRIREAIPEPAKDIRLNLGAVLEGESVLSAAQRWGVALATAEAARNTVVRDAVLEAALAAGVERAVLDDAQAAAALMAMNNVLYRFRHFVDDKPQYGDKPARLRMQRIARPAASKIDFELMCLAVSAVNGCQACVQSHERVVVGGGLTEDHVHEAVRVAAVMHAAAQAIELARLAA